MIWPFGSTPIAYEHKVHPRSKRIKLSITPQGRVLVTSPRLTPKFFIDQFVRNNSEWIERVKAKQATQQIGTNRNSVMIFGETYPIHIKYSHSEPIGIRIESKSIIFNPALDPLTTSDTHIRQSLAKHLTRYYKRTINQYIATRLPVLAQQMQVSYSSVKLREQKTRWGSCSSSGSLSFNWRLIHHPPAVIEYVLIHELAHLVHMNHSIKFWDLVRQFCPAYPQHRGWLKRTHIAEG